MSNKFNKAYQIIRGFEGGYVVDPDDVGGETYNGIAREEHPEWQGWKIVDEYKLKELFPKNLNNAGGLKELEKTFFRTRYWNFFDGDNIDEKLGTELFDIAVNLGKHRAGKYLQLCLNLLNRNEVLYNDIVVDGKIGRNTRHALKLYLEKDGNIDILVKMLNVRQGYHYIQYMLKSPIQEKYARGWFTRVSI